ncbi:hypothetical protein AAVH_18607 [Aphelenchoides avenae]|nr:hypothetical protein AAVH_18607 [Aphelenchus avenae]
MPCKRCTELSFTKESVAEFKQIVANQSQLIRILRGDLCNDINELDKRASKACSEGMNGMKPAEANQLMKDFAAQIVKQRTLIEGYQQELAGTDFVHEQAKRMSAMCSDEVKRRESAMQGEIMALEVRVEEQKRKAVEANLKLAQALRMAEKMERDLCLDSPKGDLRSSLDKRLAVVAGSLAATVNDFAELKKRLAVDSDIVAANELKKELTDLRTELKRVRTQHAATTSAAENASKELLLVRAQRDQSDEKIVDLKNEIRRLKERLEANASSNV